MACGTTRMPQLNVDPKFFNPVNGDYHLQPGSPCANVRHQRHVPAPDGSRRQRAHQQRRTGGFGVLRVQQHGHASGGHKLQLSSSPPPNTTPTPPRGRPARLGPTAESRPKPDSGELCDARRLPDDQRRRLSQRRQRPARELEDRGHENRKSSEYYEKEFACSPRFQLRTKSSARGRKSQSSGRLARRIQLASA